MTPALRPTTFAVLALLLLAGPAWAQTGPELILKPFPKELRLDTDADAWLTDTGHSKEGGQDIQIGIIVTEGRVRINPGDVASPRFGFNFTYFDLNSGVPALPRRLYDQSVAFATPIAKYDDWIIAVSGGVGYAGPTPFGDGNALYFKGDIVAVKQLDDTSGLAIAIDYDGNRTYKPDLPLPGFAYIKRIQDNLSLTVGFPVTSVEWEPFKNLRLELGYVFADEFKARAGYTLGGGVEIYGSVGQRSDAFYLEEQRHSNDRLLFQQRRVELGLTYRLKDADVGQPDLEFTVAAGYAFAGQFDIGFDTRDSHLVADVSDEPYIRFALQLRF